MEEITKGEVFEAIKEVLNEVETKYITDDEGISNITVVMAAYQIQQQKLKRLLNNPEGGIQ